MMAGHFDPNEPRDAKGRWSPTGAQSREWLKGHPIDAKNIVDMWDKATPDERHEGTEWYASAHSVAEAFATKYGVSTEQAAGVIAVYSPQTPWGANLVRAATVLRTKKPVGGKGSGVMATAAQAEAAQRILNGDDPNAILKGRKINAFFNLIAKGSGDEVVIDRHALGVARGIRAYESTYAADRPASKKRYDAFTDAFHQAASTISAKEGRPIAAHQVQSVTWLARQRLNAERVSRIGKTRKALGKKDWAEWQAFATENGFTAGAADTGYADLAREVAQEIDLSTPVDLAAINPPPDKYHTVEPPPEDDQTVRTVAEILAAGLAIDVTANAIMALLPAHVTREAVMAAVGLAGRGTAHRPNAKLSEHGLTDSGKTVVKVRDHDLYFRAAYLVKAAHRIQQSLDHGETIRAALADESLNYRRHEAARAGRLHAAAQVEQAAQVFGPLLGWYLNPLLNNETECIVADGHNFWAEDGTVVGYPGSVHANCGCTAGPPHEGATLVNEALSNVVKFAPRNQRRKYTIKKGA